ncbi:MULTISPECIES: GGDEF domain-containing protein [unclassified Campylobacter]|uniref:GGDEF domain-containing protein n=1 Tax=unclassified Campylobacter TaxID=2593542 RepID=UPI001BDA81DF|nr:MULTISPECIES: GGDEF domain-containing protein [unclassified Campylobacter]MBT0880876.1 GGDEF domain-containing protein [Campylobacter sp. 2018MI27]MBT0883940.1 GGDEF domain-containing protein [Campylobacter sp. 2018MI10]
MIDFEKRKYELVEVLQAEKIMKGILVFNLVYALIMIINDIPYLFLAYFMLAGLFLISLVFVKSNNFNACIHITFFSCFVFSASSIYYLGWGYGFEYYILPIISYFYIGIYRKKYIIYLIATFGLIYYLAMYYFFCVNDYSLDIPLYLFSDGSKFYFNCFNGIVVSTIFVIVSSVLRKQIYIELENRQNINKKLDKSANFDYLTRLMNRWCFIDSIEDLNIKSKVSIALIDVDYFKKVNDTYGHSVGDEVLKNCANLMRKHFGEYTDLICRWGGEEFLILAYNVSALDFENVCENFRIEYSNSTFSVESLTTSVSIGLVFIEDNFANNILDEYITRVDKCLYEAKNTGRNKIIKNII